MTAACCRACRRVTACRARRTAPCTCLHDSMTTCMAARTAHMHLHRPRCMTCARTLWGTLRRREGTPGRGGTPWTRMRAHMQAPACTRWCTRRVWDTLAAPLQLQGPAHKASHRRVYVMSHAHKKTPHTAPCTYAHTEGGSRKERGTMRFPARYAAPGGMGPIRYACRRLQ